MVVLTIVHDTRITTKAMLFLKTGPSSSLNYQHRRVRCFSAKVFLPKVPGQKMKSARLLDIPSSLRSAPSWRCHLHEDAEDAITD